MIETIMYQYNDFKYVEYVLNLPYDEGLEMFDQCLTRIKDNNIEKQKNRLYKLWLLELEKGVTKINNFDEYFQTRLKESSLKYNSSNYKETYEDICKEEERIKKRVNNIKIKEVKKRK